MVRTAISEPYALKIEIQNIENFTEFISPPNIVANIPWKIKIIKHIYNSNAYLGVCLCCDATDRLPNRPYVGSAEIELLNNDFSNAIMKYIEAEVYKSNEIGSCCNVIRWDVLMNEINGFLTNNGSILLNISIRANELFWDICQSVLKFQALDNCIDDARRAKFELTVNHFNNLMAVQSRQFLLYNIPWQLTVFRNYEGRLAIRLKCHIPTDDVECRMKMSVKLNSDLYPLEKYNSKLFKKNVEMVIDFLAPWDQLFVSEYQFIQKDNIVVIDVELNVQQHEGANVMEPLDENDMIQTDNSNRMICSICSKDIEDHHISFTPGEAIFCSTCIQIGNDQ